MTVLIKNILQLTRTQTTAHRKYHRSDLLPISRQWFSFFSCVVISIIIFWSSFAFVTEKGRYNYIVSSTKVDMVLKDIIRPLLSNF